MSRKYSLELEISEYDSRVLSSIMRALKPDTRNTPRECSVDVSMSSDNRLFLVIECDEISDLRALFNSYFNIISTILHIVEDVKT